MMLRRTFLKMFGWLGVSAVGVTVAEAVVEEKEVIDEHLEQEWQRWTQHHRQRQRRLRAAGKKLIDQIEDWHIEQDIDHINVTLGRGASRAVAACVGATCIASNGRLRFFGEVGLLHARGTVHFVEHQYTADWLDDIERKAWPYDCPPAHIFLVEYEGVRVAAYARPGKSCVDDVSFGWREATLRNDGTWDEHTDVLITCHNDGTATENRWPAG